MKKVIILIGLLSCVGCQDVNVKQDNDLNVNLQTGRFKVTSNQTFTDNGGYGRNILVIVDSKTKKEFVVVIGAGIRDLIHQGKAVVEN